MGAGWQPLRAYASLRNGVVSAVAGGKASVAIDGATADDVPVYGAVEVGEKVLVAAQGDTLRVIGPSRLSTAGHCRGGLSGSAPSSTATKLTLAKHNGSSTVVVAGTAATVAKAGYWAIGAVVSSSTSPASGNRSFASILRLGTPDSVISRASIGVGESFIGVSAITYLEANTAIGFDYYTQAGGTSTISDSFFYLKFLGAT